MKFLLVSNRNHNPTFDKDAIVYKEEFFHRSQKAIKKGLLSDKAAQEAFMGQFDWWFMTKQDEAVWAQIVEHLKE